MIRVNDQEVTFNVINALKFSANVKNCNVIESLGWDYCEEDVIAELFSLEKFIEEYPEGVLEEVNTMSNVRKFEPLDLQSRGNKRNKSSIEEPY